MKGYRSLYIIFANQIYKNQFVNQVDWSEDFHVEDDDESGSSNNLKAGCLPVKITSCKNAPTFFLSHCSPMHVRQRDLSSKCSKVKKNIGIFFSPSKWKANASRLPSPLRGWSSGHYILRNMTLYPHFNNTCNMSTRFQYCV